MTSARASEPADAQPLPSPWRRSWPWWPLQMIMQSFWAVWLNYRAQGVEHIPNDRGALLLINHRSMMDPFLAGLAIRRPVSFVARHNLFEIPGLGSLFRRTYVIPLNRDAAGSSSIREITRRLQYGFLVGLFPEGTRHSGPDPLGPLKPGFVSILRRADVPVIPVGIAGAEEVMPRGALKLRPRPVRVVIGPQIPESQLSALKVRGRESELIDLVQAKMVECVIAAQNWLHEQPGRTH